MPLTKLVSIFHGLGDDETSLVTAEPHGVCLLALLECDDELVVGLRGLASSRGQNTDKVTVVPLVGGLHGARVVGGDGGRAHREHPLVLPFPGVLGNHE